MWIEIQADTKSTDKSPVTPRAGVWIEIMDESMSVGLEQVTPRAGVWIEIRSIDGDFYVSCASLPVRECGLKYLNL